MKILCMKKYSNGKIQCNCCGEKNIIFLTIDHIKGRKFNKHDKTLLGRKLYTFLLKSKYIDTIQVLCFNCNCGRKINGGICPHLEKKCQ